MAGETIITQWLNAVNSDEKRISSIIELQDGGGHFMTLSNIISSKKLERLPGRVFSQLVDERYTFIMSTLTETYNFNMTELINPALCKEGIELELEKVALLLLCALVQTIILTENHAELLIPLYGLDAELHQTIIDAISSIIEGGNDICALTMALEHTLSSIHEKEAPVSVSQKKQPKKRRSTQRESQLRVFLESSGLYKQVHNKVVDILKNKVCKLENEKTVDISQSSSSSSSMLSFGTKELTACANDTEKVQLLEEKYKDLERRYLEQKEDLHKTKGKLDVKIIELKAAENNSQFQHNLLQRQQAEFKAQKDKDETSSTSSLLKQNKEIEQQMKRIKGLEDKTKELTTLKKTQIAELADMKRANRKLQRELDTITERYGSVIQKSEDYEKDREQLESNCNCFKLKVEELTQQLQEFSQNRDDHSEPMIGQVEEIKGHERLKESSHGGESAISKIERDTESIAVKLENESALSPLRQDLELQLVSCKEQITNRNMQLVEHQGRIKEYELRVTQYEEEKKNCDEKVLRCEETVKSNDKQFKNKVKELKVQISECQKQLTECQKQVADCQKQISGDQLQIVQYQETIKSNELQFENKVKELDFQIAEHKERISEDERQIVQYQETIKSNELQFENKVKELDFQIAECKERISEDERQIVQYQETIKSNELQFENKVKELDFQIAEYKERISDDELQFENKVKELDVQIAECQKQISGDERQIVQYEETIKSNELQFENKVKELDVQISDYKGQIVLFQDIIKSNESLEVKHKAKIAEASSEMARCTEEVQNGKLRIAECERENRNLQSSLSQNREEMREVKSKIIEYEVKVQEQQSQINRYIESEKDLTFKLSQCEESEKTQGLLIAELKKTKTNLQLELSEKLTELQKTAELLSELEMKSQTLSMKPTHVAHERYSVELKKKDEEIAKLENLVKEKIKLLKSEKKSYNECKRELEYTGELLKNEKSMHEQKLSGLTAEKNAAFEALKMEYTHKLENREQLLKKEIKKQMRDKDTVAVKEENRWLQGENKKKENTITKLQTEMDDRTNIFQEQMMTVEQMKNKKIGQLLTDKETLEKKMTELQKTCEQETANYNSNFEKLRNEISEKAAAIDGMQTTLKLKEELLSASHQERDALLQKIQACSHIEEISKAKLKELEAKFAERTNIFQEQMMSVEQAKNEKINQLLAEKEIVQKECAELREEYNSNLEKLRSEISEKASVIDNMQATIKMKDEDLNASHQERDSLLEKLRSEISEKASVIDNLQATLKIKDADLNASHQERDSLLEKLRSEISEKTSVIDSMQATMKMKDEDLNASHQERDSLLKNVQECRRIEEMSTAKLKELDAKFVERTNILQEQIMLIEQAKNETISQLLTDKEKLQEKYNNDLEKLRSEISEKASVIDNLQATLTIKDADLNASHQEHDSLLEKLRSEISEKTSTIDNMKVTDKSKDDKLSASYQERDALLKKIKECGRIEEVSTAKLEELDAKFVANRKLLDNSYLANEALIQKLSDVQEQNKELTASLENLRVQKEKLTRKVSNMQIQNLGLSFRIDGFQNTEVSSSQQHPSPEKEASEQNEENSTKLTSARLDVQTLSKQIEALGEKKVQVEKLNTDLKEKIKELENQLEEASELNNENVMKLGSAQLEVESLSKQMEALGETKMQAENLNADLKEKIKELESQLEEASELNDENVMKLGSAQLEVESLSKQIEALGETKMHAENLNADLKEKIKELESQLEEASKLNDENVMKLGSAQLEVESLSKQIEALGETKMHAESLNADLKEKIKELESQLEIKTENLKEQIAVTETAAEESSKKLHQEQLCEPDAMIGKRQTEGSISCDDEQDLSPEEELEVTCEIFILAEDFLVEIRNEKESVLGAVEAFKTVLDADHQRELIQKLEASVEAANERLRERIENICAEKNQEMNDLQAEKDVKIKTLTEDLELSEELKLKLFDKVQRIHQFVGEDHEAEDEKLRNALVRRERDVKMMTAKIKALKSELSQKTKIADDFNEVVRRYREERKKIKRLFGDNDALREKLTFLEEIYTDTKIVGKMMGDVKRLTDERDREHNSFEYWKQRAYTSEYLMGQYQDDLSRHKRMIRMTRIKLTLLSDHPDAEEYLKIQTDRRKRARDPENDLKDDEYFPLVAADDDFSFLEEYSPDYSHNCTQTMPVAIKKITDISVPGPSGIEEQPKEKVLFGKTPAMRFRKAKIEKEQDLERRKKLPAGHPERYVPKQKRKKPLPKRYVAALDIPTSSSEEVECSGCISPVRKRRKVFDWVTGC